MIHDLPISLNHETPVPPFQMNMPPIINVDLIGSTCTALPGIHRHGVKLHAAGAALIHPHGRGLHSFTFQLNLSRV